MSNESFVDQVAPVHHTGWEALAGLLSGRSVLCLDDGMQAVESMAQRCAHVTALCPTSQEAARLRQHVQASGWTHVSVVSLDSAPEMASLSGEPRFDGAVLCDLAGLAQPRIPGGLSAMATLVRSRLREGAFVLAGAPNLFGVSRDRLRDGTGKRSSRTWSSLQKLIGDAGAGHTTIHPLVMGERGRVSEKICAGGYHATKNHGLRRERIKEWLWSSSLARWFAPALLGIGWIGEPGVSLVDSVGLLLEGSGGKVQLTQYLALISGKVIAMFTPVSTSEPARVVVITSDRLTIERRLREAKTLQQLTATLPPALVALLPDVMGRFQVDGCECFVLRHIPGVTADAIVPGLETITLRSHDFLLDLHRATAKRSIMTTAAWNEGVGAIFDVAVRRNDTVASELRHLEERVRERLVGHEWYSVCSHGDFKIENVMYDPTTHQITGVIDWEHAMPSGLPYIDTAYLLTYNRMLHGASWLDASRALLEQQFSEQEAAIDAHYWEATGLPQRLVPVWRALVIVHHIGCRWHGSWSGRSLDDLKSLLSLAADLVEHVPLLEKQA